MRSESCNPLVFFAFAIIGLLVGLPFGTMLEYNIAIDGVNKNITIGDQTYHVLKLSNGTYIQCVECYQANW